MHASVQYRCCCNVLEELGIGRRWPQRLCAVWLGLTAPAKGIRPEHYVQFCDSCVVDLRSASTVLYCTALYCIVLCSAVLCCAVLYHTVFFDCVVLCFAVLYCTALYSGLVSHPVRLHTTQFRQLVRELVCERNEWKWKWVALK